MARVDFVTRSLGTPIEYLLHIETIKLHEIFTIMEKTLFTPQNRVLRSKRFIECIRSKFMIL